MLPIWQIKFCYFLCSVSLKHTLSLLDLDQKLREIRAIIEQSQGKSSSEKTGSQSLLCHYMMPDEENPLATQVFAEHPEYATLFKIVSESELNFEPRI